MNKDLILTMLQIAFEAGFERGCVWTNRYGSCIEDIGSPAWQAECNKLVDKIMKVWSE